MCALIVKKKADYLFNLKGNHRAKVKELALQFLLKPSQSYSTVDKGHGRIEERILKVMDMPAHLKALPGVSQALELTRKRYHKGRESVEIVYAITSLKPEKATPEQLMKLWREHWGIENRLHRTRDLTLDEDRSTLRKGSSPQIMAALRNTTIQITQKCNLPLSLAIHIGARFPKRIIKMLQEN